jgi:hypothetical protein
MALVSPGLQITVTDESQYLPTALGTVPFVLIATAENKTINGVTAPGTTKANAGQVYGVTSQRELAATFGYPQFRQSSAGTPLHGNELNEYGLMAAYSALGLGNRVWVIRADVDLNQLVGTTVRPVGKVANNTVWLDTSATSFGLFGFDRATNMFTKITPTLIDSASDCVVGTTQPKASVGTIGSYAVIVFSGDNYVYYKNASNTWVQVGSTAWTDDIPAVTSNTSTVNIASNRAFTINGATINTGNAAVTTMSGLSSLITAANIVGITSSVSSTGRLQIFAGASATNSAAAIVSGTADLTTIGIENAVYGRANVHYGTYAQVPSWSIYDSVSRPNGSIWVKTSVQGSGTNFVVKKYNSNLASWAKLAMPVYADGFAALYGIDPAGGGTGIAAGSSFVKYNSNNDGKISFTVYTLGTAGQTKVTGSNVPGATAFVSSDRFSVTVSVPGTTTPSTHTCILLGTGPSDFVASILAANIPNVTAQVEVSGSISITHRAGGIITLTDTVGNPVNDAGFVAGTTAGVVSNIVTGAINLSNWSPAVYTFSNMEPNTNPENGRLWYYNDPSTVDIMINDTTGWKGYKNITRDPRGFDLTVTDPNGVIISATEPTTQTGTSGAALAPGDLWLDSSDLENYPRLYRYSSNSTWSLIDNTDKVSQNGIIFADARWDTNGTTNPVTGDMPRISELHTSNYLDLDAPDYRLYPRGTLLFNTRRSGYNVKRFVHNYFNTSAFGVSAGALPAQTSTWVSDLGLRADGSPFMGHYAQRDFVVQALKAAVDGNLDIREEAYAFNLLACPGYPELVTNLAALNNDRANTGFVIGDTPMTLTATMSSIALYNASITSSDPYVGLFYPSALTTDLSGNEIAVPPSHMMLRTFLHSDNVSYQWFAPAGTRRGLIDNATAIGYIDPDSGLFVRSGISQQLRDSLYELRMNPITLLAGAGIVAYGQKTRSPAVGGGGSSMDRINVARLVNYLRTILRGVANQFLFEPNDKITRDQVKQLVESVLNDLIAKRGLYDYLVVCDDSNNTSDRIARNELYVDVAIEPMKDVEFIYIPIRLKNPGSIAGTSTTV